MNNRFFSFLILMYCLTTVLVPVFIWNKLVFLPLFATSVYLLLSRPTKTLAPIVVVGIFFYGCLLAMLNEADTDLAKQVVVGSATLFLIYVIHNYDVDMGRAVKTTGAIFALTMCSFSFLLMAFPGSYIGTALLNYYNINELGFYGVRNFGSLQMFMLGGCRI